MKLFGRKGKSIRIEVILAIVILLLVLCMGFGYCLRFVHRDGYSVLPPPEFNVIHHKLDTAMRGVWENELKRLTTNPSFFERVKYIFSPGKYKERINTLRGLIEGETYAQRYDAQKQKWQEERDRREQEFADKWDLT